MFNWVTKYKLCYSLTQFEVCTVSYTNHVKGWIKVVHFYKHKGCFICISVDKCQYSRDFLIFCLSFESRLFLNLISINVSSETGLSGS